MAEPPPCREDPQYRNAELGYSPSSELERLVRYVSHGTPSPLIRWHYHDDYEIHLVVATSGKMFVGDYIGTFEPGNLVMTGPKLPHNWISTNAPPEGVALRDHCIVFDRSPIERASALISELGEVLPLLDRCAQGIEFFGMSECAAEYFARIRASKDLARLSVFLDFLSVLGQWKEFRLLSNPWVDTADDPASMTQIDSIVGYMNEHYSDALTMPRVAKHFDISRSHFSRIFHRRTGNTFSSFLTQLRISRACQLLVKSQDPVSAICYDVGFNNVANFNRRFRDVKGMTPTAFRRKFADSR
ncbi:AraC family transcriptional regulator [Variovorax sp. KK3]|uniref:AraC family transcriptional regulator n=1 Tax=Variovorax sp. KK3 TaxID=1855728 RepID=UPI00097BDE68|nr:AraC family transcriptional regulator [Variovorax sp. KK3]